jgi:hypothetical protein
MVTSEPPVSDREKQECLQAVLTSATFARSTQLRALLRYICERDMAGQAHDLTEYQIAVDVLGRRKNVDLAEDASVRNRAYELRQRLEKYYTTEQPHPGIRIEIPRGGYLPLYTRHPAAAEPGPEPPAEPRKTGRVKWVVAAGCLVAGFAAGLLLAPAPHPASILKEAWGPLADPSGDLLVVIATNMHMLVRPHIAPHSRRLPAPDEVYPLYGPQRPLAPGAPLYMEPAPLSIPLGEVAATATLTNLRTAFGGGYQILPESEAPVAALRGRNAVLIGSGTNSQAATALLRNLPFTIDYTPNDQFAVLDRRKPPGQNQLFLSQPTGDPVATVLYGLLTVITSADSQGAPKRTVVVSGSSSAGVQAAVEFFCSPLHMRELKDRLLASGLKSLPPTYQVVVRCKTSGVRLLSYEYAAHAVVERTLTAPE